VPVGMVESNTTGNPQATVPVGMVGGNMVSLDMCAERWGCLRGTHEELTENTPSVSTGTITHKESMTGIIQIVLSRGCLIQDVSLRSDRFLVCGEKEMTRRSTAHGATAPHPQPMAHGSRGNQLL